MESLRIYVRSTTKSFFAHRTNLKVFAQNHFSKAVFTVSFLAVIAVVILFASFYQTLNQVQLSVIPAPYLHNGTSRMLTLNGRLAQFKM